MKLCKSFLVFTLCVYLIGCESREPRPKIKYGEFPFLLIYIESNKKYVIKDAVICEYDGRNYTENGIYNSWKKSYSSGRKEMLIKTLGADRYITFADGSPVGWAE